LIERTRGRRRFALLVLYTLTIAVFGSYTWRISRIMSVPDVGYPFDMKEFLAFELPPERNAYVLYKRAYAKLHQPFPSEIKLGNLVRGGWKSIALSNEQSELLEANRGALELWRSATECSDAMANSPRELASTGPTPKAESLSFPFRALANMEISRLQSAGDMATAWTWHRALLRAGHLSALHAGPVERIHAVDQIESATHRIIDWANDPRVHVTLLENAVADVLEIDQLVPSDEFTLKAEYLQAMRELDDPRNTEAREETPSHPLYSMFQLFGRKHWFPATGYRFFGGDPEISRRIMRLVFANYLAHAKKPTLKRALRVIVPVERGLSRGSWDLFLYEVSPDSPSSARAMSQTDMARSLLKTWDAKLILAELAYYQRQLAVSRRGDLAYTLAEQWYRREHDGNLPPDPEALLGRYLKTLQLADPSDVSDQGIPVFEDSKN
jgi:hypothetical protein